MAKKQKIQLFEEKKVRTVWDDDKEKWFFCVVDVVEALTESKDPKDYIKKMKKRDPELSKGWGQIVTPPYHSYTRRSAKSELCSKRGRLPYHPGYSVPQGRTF